MVRYVVNRHSSAGHDTGSGTTVHRADCTSAVRYGAGPEWIWPFEAQAAVGTTGYPVTSCGHRRPWLRRSGE